MRKLLLFLLLSALTLGFSPGALRSAPARSYQTRQLRKQHKEQRKDLKQQERTMKKIMDQHELSDEQRKRFKHDLKTQQRLLRKTQKDDSRRLNRPKKLPRQLHTLRSDPHFRLNHPEESLSKKYPCSSRI
jgi:Spy/CpxP family protein refolding chaperone